MKTFVIILVLILVSIKMTAHFVSSHDDKKSYESTGYSISRVETFVGYRTVTAYTAGNPAETDGSPCLGAWGDDICQMLEDGVNVVASNEFPRGTILRVGDTAYYVFDRTNSRYDHRIDIAKSFRQDALLFGRQVLAVRNIKLYENDKSQSGDLHQGSPTNDYAAR